MDHKDGTVPEKGLLLLMRPCTSFFKVQNTPVLLVRATGVCLRGPEAAVLPPFSDVLLLDAVCTLGLCFVPEFPFAEWNDAMFHLWSECYKEERAAVLQPVSCPCTRHRGSN